MKRALVFMFFLNTQIVCAQIIFEKEKLNQISLSVSEIQRKVLENSINSQSEIVGFFEIKLKKRSLSKVNFFYINEDSTWKELLIELKCFLAAEPILAESIKRKNFELIIPYLFKRTNQSAENELQTSSVDIVSVELQAKKIVEKIKSKRTYLVRTIIAREFISY